MPNKSIRSQRSQLKAQIVLKQNIILREMTAEPCGTVFYKSVCAALLVVLAGKHTPFQSCSDAQAGSPRSSRDLRKQSAPPVSNQTGANGTVTNGAANFAQSCATFVQSSRKSGKFRANSANFACFRIFLTYTPVYYTPVCSVPTLARRDPAADGSGRSRSGKVIDLMQDSRCALYFRIIFQMCALL